MQLGEVHDDKLVSAGVRIFPVGRIEQPRRFSLSKISAEHAARHALLTIALAGFALAFFLTPEFWASVAFSALIGWLSLFKR